MAMLGAFESNQTVNMTFSVDMLTVDTLTYSVFDNAGNTLLSEQPATLDSDYSVQVAIPAEVNQIGDADRALRRVKLKATTGTTTVEFENVYVLLNNFELAVFEQSFATLDDAAMYAIDMVKGDVILNMSRVQLRRLLIEATVRLKQMPFSIRRIFGVDYDDYDRPMNMLNVHNVYWGQEGQYRMDLIDWSKMSPELYAGLPDDFKKTLLVATVNEVAEIASTTDSQSARDEGIVSESIGETTIAYRQGKAANLTVNRTTWRLLVKYLNNRTVVRRS
ncbi:hypothetical protein ACJ5X2_003909 [Klebsiella quasipneumoniae]|uniref:hypothetical protein n=1 Tax=Klebsiella TaxID=570 RepID=UPI000664DD79|nr:MULTISPECIES: hypothetical protein [Klebsiella]QBL52312.1 hypothetical protein BMD99_028125 [Klebsiella sp. PO552]QLT68222.1 hypothetical protein HV202_31120 [Klebsiella oxytoca]HCA4366181.1 hypothetical protein [Klebsiella variicola subsp. variicola]HCI4233318.1 hypothetical protein [Klebsiella quasipneumoniae subsp. similipneumoniae]HCI6031472.1 hypothetical protein [Klebsiella quasipneumoniae subsp. quasipneumoniae]HDU3818728.1 hypothetical protein [Klebsiella pneumoniae subsp. pneumoni